MTGGVASRIEITDDAGFVLVRDGVEAESWYDEDEAGVITLHVWIGSLPADDGEEAARQAAGFTQLIEDMGDLQEWVQKTAAMTPEEKRGISLQVIRERHGKESA